MYTKAQLNDAIAALQALRSKDVPWYEQGFITDEILTEVANTVLSASNSQTAFISLQKFRSVNVPEFEQGYITDALLHTLVATVLDATKDK